MMLGIKCPTNNVEIVQVIKVFVKLSRPHIWLDFTGVFAVKFLEQKKGTLQIGPSQSSALSVHN